MDADGANVQIWKMVRNSHAPESDDSTSSFQRSSSSRSNGTGSRFSKFTSDWDSNSVDKLGVRFQNEDIFSVIISKWCLFHLSANDYRQIEKCVSACDLKLDYETLDAISSTIVTPIKNWVTWKPDEEQLKIIRTEPLLQKFEVQLEEFNYCLALIIASRKSDPTVSLGKYQTLFKKLLHLFDIFTWSEPFLETQKTMIMGKTVRSTASLLCCRSDPGIARPVVCVCEIKKTCSEEEESGSRPWKKLRCSSSEDSTSGVPLIERNLLSPHIGDLFVYLNQSVRNEGVLGVTVEKTLVQITFLQVEKSSMEKIQFGNGAGCVNFTEMKRPTLYFSRRYNFLKRDDRKILFKAFLLIKLMQNRYEKGSDT